MNTTTALIGYVIGVLIFMAVGGAVVMGLFALLHVMFAGVPAIGYFFSVALAFLVRVAIAVFRS